MHFVGELLLIGDGTRADELHDDERIRSITIHRMDDGSSSGLKLRTRPQPHRSLPGLTRQSMRLSTRHSRKILLKILHVIMDARVEPTHD